MDWYNWILLPLIIIFGGYLINRILFWISSFLWEWTYWILYGERYWFPKGYKIKDIINESKYELGVPPAKGFESYSQYKDSYSIIHQGRWIPIIGIFPPLIMFFICVFYFIFGIIISILRISYICAKNTLWKYFFKYIFNFIFYILKRIYNFIKKYNLRTKIDNFKEKIFNIKIA